MIQTNNDNYQGGIDVVTNQYDFSGKVLVSCLVHDNPEATANQQVKINTLMTYDHAGRLLEIHKTISDDAGKTTRIASNEYDELGQLKTKKF